MENVEVLKEQANELMSILEIMPDDIGTLNSLVFTYLELENLPRAEDYASKLVMTLRDSGDEDMIADYIQQYIELAPQSQLFPELLNTPSSNQPKSEETQILDSAEDLEAQLAMLEAQEAQFSQKEEELTEDSPIKINDPVDDINAELEEFTLQLSAELELADFLKSKEVITETQAETAISTLIENSSQDRTSVPLTFLNELSLIEHTNMDKVLSTLSKSESIPFIKVKQFTVNDELREIIPPLTAKKLGIVIFSIFKGELLMAISNPLDIELRQGLERILNKKIHFYLTSPDEIMNFYNQ